METLNLFEQDFVLESKVFEKANNLIDLLNDGCKERYRYYATGIFKYKNLWIFRANQKGEKSVYNIIDDNGNIPLGMEVNWRIWSHILKNISSYEKTTENICI